ncbi:unnamed protein product [Rotaria sordida]|uniref:Uncharacterized protein n=1 Tax=Rotaria sordida TaxID=392033 RepID=A0A814B6R7_9BILA|nr:unnamed protein product [Rotaria sordida]CAF0838208.1 unnamed protein product [Rotaria sordida]CAF0922656.1 unnamed protein product [Rotaria sordida]CAF1168092.1 unnamed protein product [Rotaria sordida]CAF3537873.1 unnamed protein product [Rotaria sordida]
MSNIQSMNVDNQNSMSTIDKQIIDSSNRNNIDTNKHYMIKTTNWTERIKNYFITNDGRIVLADFFFTLLCVILQHIMGTCEHSISNGTTVIKWYVFTPPFGAGPHTAVYFFVLSWITLVYCIERIWIYLITDVRTSKKRDLIVHGIIVILYFIALGFNIWGYVLCESTSQLNTSKTFTPGVCRGDSQACIPLIAGVLTSCAAACAFFSEHIVALMKLLRNRQESNGSISNRILL